MDLSWATRFPDDLGTLGAELTPGVVLTSRGAAPLEAHFCRIHTATELTGAALWKSFAGDCTPADRLDLALRDADVEWPGAFGACTMFDDSPVAEGEVRGTQSKRYLEEKVKLFLEHQWPLVWIVRVERGEVEVCELGRAPVVFRAGSSVPLPSALQQRGLTSVPVECFLQDEVAVRYVADTLVDEGKRLGLDEGKRLGLRDAVRDMCELLSIPWDADRERQLAALDVDGLEALRARLKRERNW